MKAPPGPPRLRDSEEFGAELRLLDGESLSEERLARNSASLEQKMAGIVAAAGVAGAAGAAAAAGKTASVALWLKIGLPTVIAAAAAGTTYVALRPSEHHKPAPQAVVQSPPANHRQPRSAAPPPDASVPADPDGAVMEDATTLTKAPAPPTSSRRRRPARRPAAAAPEPPPSMEPPSAPATPPSAAPPAPAVTPTPPQPPAPSRLPEQIRLFEAAKRAGRARQHKKAIALIDALLRHFPTTPLAAEARLSRAEFLVRAGRIGAATTAVRGLLADPRHAGRRGELLRVLGDLLRKQGDCRGAAVAYRQALATSLTKRDARAARRGLAACRREKK